MTLTRLVNTKARCSKCEGHGHYDYQCPSKIPNYDVDNSKVVKDVHVHFKTTSIIEYVSVGSNALLVDEGHASYEDISEAVDAIVESSIP